MEEVCRRSKGKRLYSTAYCISIVTLGLVQAALAQNQTTQPTTDPSEASALNMIFQKWGLSAPAGTWITNSNICAGRAVDNTSFDTSAYNPLIKCDCSFNNSSICHITQLKVYAISGTGTTIPDELWTLTYLTNLVLAQNVLTGPISPSIGNLMRLQRLSLAINALSGELPKELGMLSNLLSLSIALNNFSGPLPSELGNLTKLEKLYFNSAGVSGPLPSTFANLRNLKVVWASDNELTGPIPNFIGNWSKLTQLFLHGTSFDGPIPSSLSTLISLIDLRISGISSGSSSLAFIKDMKNLTTLAGY